MKRITAAQLNDFLFDQESGFLIKYHFNVGLDVAQLDQLYGILVRLQSGWNAREDVPKDILFYLIIIVPTLYNDLHLYQKTDKYSLYKTLIYDLNKEVGNCLAPAPGNRPLRDSASQLEDFLFHPASGFLTKYHLKEGLDFTLLDQLYEILEDQKLNWKDKKEVPKDLVYYLITLVPALYLDLTMYEETDNYELYLELIGDLATATEMCLNPDTNSKHFQKPLRNPG
ncbi:hypothetical protein [Chitinophaga dinghuensis]|nr:hypothetical protein [Chitinophaga dinghuensis]